MSRDPLLFLEDIEKSCEKVVQYTQGRSKDQVFEDDIRVDAILLNLYVIGEAVKKLPSDLRERYPPQDRHAGVSRSADGAGHGRPHQVLRAGAQGWW